MSRGKSAIELERERSIDTIEAVITLMGSVASSARAMSVDVSSIFRYRTGRTILRGAALVAARAVIRHPEDYSRFKIRKSEN